MAHVCFAEGNTNKTMNWQRTKGLLFVSTLRYLGTPLPRLSDGDGQQLGKVAIFRFSLSLLYIFLKSINTKTSKYKFDVHHFTSISYIVLYFFLLYIVYI